MKYLSNEFHKTPMKAIESGTKKWETAKSHKLKKNLVKMLKAYKSLYGFSGVFLKVLLASLTLLKRIL